MQCSVYFSHFCQLLFRIAHEHQTSVIPARFYIQLVHVVLLNLIVVVPLVLPISVTFLAAVVLLYSLTYFVLIIRHFPNCSLLYLTISYRYAYCGILWLSLLLLLLLSLLLLLLLILFSQSNSDIGWVIQTWSGKQTYTDIMI